MDFKAEQDTEIEALQSIYGDELSFIPNGFSVAIEYQDLTVCFEQTFTTHYPEELPTWNLITTGLSDTEERELDAILLETAESSLGSVMGFSLVSVIQEGLEGIKSKRLERAEQAKEAKLKAEEEEELKRMTGTKVTKESFDGIE